MQAWMQPALPTAAAACLPLPSLLLPHQQRPRLPGSDRRSAHLEGGAHSGADTGSHAQLRGAGEPPCERGLPLFCRVLRCDCLALAGGACRCLPLFSPRNCPPHLRPPTPPNKQDLAAFWRFNDPSSPVGPRQALVATDSSGRGNHLPLATLPAASMQTLGGSGAALHAGALAFRNNFAHAPQFSGMPDRWV